MTPYLRLSSPAKDDPPRLSPRRLECLCLAALGHSDAEIALRMGVALSAVLTHMKYLRQTYAVRSRTQLAGIAHRQGPIGVEEIMPWNWGCPAIRFDARLAAWASWGSIVEKPSVQLRWRPARGTPDLGAWRVAALARAEGQRRMCDRVNPNKNPRDGILVEVSLYKPY